MKSISKKRKPYLKPVVAVLVGIGVLSFGFPFLVKSFTADSVVIENYYEAAREKAEEALGGLLEVGERIFTSRVTVNDVAYNGDFKIPLDFSRGATTTAGGLFSKQNLSGADRICSVVKIDLTTAVTKGGRLDTGHPLVFSVATSTEDGGYSTKSASVMASTTSATGTAILLDNVRKPGSYSADGSSNSSATTTPPWIWGKDVYLLGAFDSLSTDAATSSLVYEGMTGNAYLDCHQR